MDNIETQRAKRRVSVFDDHELFLGALVRTVKEGPFVVVGKSTSEIEVLERATGSDIILLDWGMSDRPSELVRNLKHKFPTAKIVIVSASESSTDVVAALRCGASGYISKRSSGAEILEAMCAIERRELYITPSLGVAVPACCVHDAESSGWWH